jgi:hypothetical protein
MTFPGQTGRRQSTLGSARRQPENQPRGSDVTATTRATMTVSLWVHSWRAGGARVRRPCRRPQSRHRSPLRRVAHAGGARDRRGEPARGRRTRNPDVAAADVLDLDVGRSGKRARPDRGSLRRARGGGAAGRGGARRRSAAPARHRGRWLRQHGGAVGADRGGVDGLAGGCAARRRLGQPWPPGPGAERPARRHGADVCLRARLRLRAAMDNLGAIVGPVLALGLVGLVGVRTAMLLSVIPGLPWRRSSTRSATPRDPNSTSASRSGCGCGRSCAASSAGS